MEPPKLVVEIVCPERPDAPRIGMIDPEITVRLEGGQLLCGEFALDYLDSDLTRG